MSAVAMLILCLPKQARAQSAIELQLEAPSGCPGRAAILSAVGRLVQKPPREPLNARARFARQGEDWVVELAFDQGQRRVTGDTCVAVAEALVVILALAVDPSAKLNVATFTEFEHPKDEPPNNAAALGTQPPLTLQGAIAPAPVVYPTGSPGAAAPATHRDDSVPNQPEGPARLGLSVSMLAEKGALPSGSLGPSLFFRYGKRRAWGELSILWLLPRWASVDPTINPNKGGNISLLAGQMAGCFAPLSAPVLGGCLGAELGDLIGKGAGVDHPQTAYALWPAVTANAVLRTEIRSALGLEARLGLAVPALRPEFGLAGYRGFFSPNWGSLRASLGFSWR